MLNDSKWPHLSAAIWDLPVFQGFASNRLTAKANSNTTNVFILKQSEKYKFLQNSYRYDVVRSESWLLCGALADWRDDKMQNIIIIQCPPTSSNLRRETKNLHRSNYVFDTAEPLKTPFCQDQFPPSIFITETKLVNLNIRWKAFGSWMRRKFRQTDRVFENHLSVIYADSCFNMIRKAP